MTIIYNRKSELEKRKALRNNMPLSEIILWSKLKSSQLLGYKFRRQYSVGSFIVDFYCRELRLAIEVDGESHNSKEAIQYDQERQKYIEQFNIQFIRFKNEEVQKNIYEVLERLRMKIDEINKSGKEPPPSPSF